VGEFRRFPVPSGLDGLRADAGLAKMLGLSRTTVAAMLDAGEVRCDGAAVARSERLAAGTFVELTLPTPPAPLTITAEPVDGLTVLHVDRDLEVVNKPVGVAAHASPGWTWAPPVSWSSPAAKRRIRS
jgi:23S rRNA pseudouridine1911/1915/1917 synthase